MKRAPKPTKSAAVRLKPVPTPRPFDLADEETKNQLEELHVLANTAEVLDKLGATRALPDVPADILKQEKELLKSVIAQEKTKPRTPTNLPVALGAAAFLRSYGQSLALDVTQIRSALTNKLLELADNGDPRIELKAIELLGKHSDIGLFTERSEITVNYTSPEELEKAIKERVKRLLGSDSDGIEITSLEEELGLMIEDGEYEDVVDGPEDDEDDEAVPSPDEGDEAPLDDEDDAA